MAKRVFYSFQFKPDHWRASQVRNIGTIEGNKPASDNDWEAVVNKGDSAIQNWIDGQMDGRSCTIVLIGANTAGRKWINYEIEKSWNDGKGLLGIYIHNLKNSQGLQSSMGSNPFVGFTMHRDNDRLSNIVKTYDPPYSDSKKVYDYISANLEFWIDQAIKIRNNY